MAALQMEDSRQVSMKIALLDDDIMCLSLLAQMEVMDHRNHRHLYASMSTTETPPSTAVLISTWALALALNRALGRAFILALVLLRLLWFGSQTMLRIPGELTMISINMIDRVPRYEASRSFLRLAHSPFSMRNSRES